jgi:hypothetical protein
MLGWKRRVSPASKGFTRSETVMPRIAGAGVKRPLDYPRAMAWLRLCANAEALPKD